MTKKCEQPILFFSMQLDNNLDAIKGINQGRLSLWDYNLGFIGRWVCTSSLEAKQGVADWETRGGIHPPNYAMPDEDWFYIKFPLIKQLGQPVDEGYLNLYKGSNLWTTKKGNKRSEVMTHCDKNHKTSPGSFGCLVMVPSEWEDFKSSLFESCGHLPGVRLGVMYNFQV
jgi:hypothetical protein